MTQRNDEVMSKSRKTMLPHFGHARICTISRNDIKVTRHHTGFYFYLLGGGEQWKLPLPIKNIIKENLNDVMC